MTNRELSIDLREQTTVSELLLLRHCRLAGKGVNVDRPQWLQGALWHNEEGVYPLRACHRMSRTNLLVCWRTSATTGQYEQSPQTHGSSLYTS